MSRLWEREDDEGEESCPGVVQSQAEHCHLKKNPHVVCGNRNYLCSIKKIFELELKQKFHHIHPPPSFLSRSYFLPPFLNPCIHTSCIHLSLPSSLFLSLLPSLSSQLTASIHSSITSIQCSIQLPLTNPSFHPPITRPSTIIFPFSPLILYLVSSIFLPTYTHHIHSPFSHLINPSTINYLRNITRLFTDP